MHTRSRLLAITLAALLPVGAIVFNASPLGASGDNTMVPRFSRPTYAPDGREVAFETNWRQSAEEIWAVSTVDGGLRPIADGFEPAWSPTDSWIAFVPSKVGHTNIWLVRPDGSGLTQLTPSTTTRDSLLRPAWSPEGGQIAFVSVRTGTRNIWVINVDGSGLRRVTDAPCCQNDPSFSPDGRQIVFQATAPTESHLMIINADGTGLRQLTPGAGPVRDVSPSWGSRGILFESHRTGGSIWMIQPDGSGLQAIPKARGGSPTWSPDGTKFAFRGSAGVHEFNFLTGTIRPLVEIKGFFIPIDIMPGVSSKIISLKKTNLIRVAILPAPTRRSLLAGFDLVSQLSQTSVTFGRTGDERSLDSCTAEGANLVCQFKTAQTGFQPGNTLGILRGWLVIRSRDGQESFAGVEGRSTLQVVP